MHNLQNGHSLKKYLHIVNGKMTLEITDNMEIDIENVDSPGPSEFSNTSPSTTPPSSPVNPSPPSSILNEDKDPGASRPETPNQQQQRVSTFLIDDILKPTFGSKSSESDSDCIDLAENERDNTKPVHNESQNNQQDPRVPHIGFSVVSILQQHNISKRRALYGRPVTLPDSPIRHSVLPEKPVPNIILPTSPIARNIALCHLQSENSQFDTSGYQHLLQQQLRRYHQIQLQDIYKNTSHITPHVHQRQNVIHKPKQQPVEFKTPPSGCNFSNSVLSRTNTNTPPQSPSKSLKNEDQFVDKNSGRKSDSDPDSGADSSNPVMWPAWVYCTRYSDRPSSGRCPRSRKMKRKEKTPEDKRPRTAFTNEQLGKLRQEFEDNRYLTEERRQRLARELQLTDAQVKIWFQNKRAKMKKAMGSRNPLALQLMAQGLYNHATFPTDGSEGDGMDVSGDH